MAKRCCDLRSTRQMKKYISVWLIMTSGAIQGMFVSKFGFMLFMIAKLLRFFLYLGFLYFLLAGGTKLLSYSRNEVLLFFLTFAVIAGFSQMFFREVYRFRPRVVSGDFDFDLVKPIHPLLRNLTGGFDVLDLLTLPVYLYFLITTIGAVGFTPGSLFLYFLLAINGFMIIAAFHIFVLAFGIITSSVDHAVMLYRDIENMARFPIYIYAQPLQAFLMFIIPIGIIFTVPAQVIVGGLSWQFIALAFALGLGFFALSIYYWNNAVKKYSSASS